MLAGEISVRYNVLFARIFYLISGRVRLDRPEVRGKVRMRSGKQEITFEGASPMAIQATEKIWHNGKLIPWKDAQIHVMAHVVNYGSSVDRKSTRLNSS